MVWLLGLKGLRMKERHLAADGGGGGLAGAGRWSSGTGGGSRL